MTVQRRPFETFLSTALNKNSWTQRRSGRLWRKSGLLKGDRIHTSASTTPRVLLTPAVVHTHWVGTDIMHNTFWILKSRSSEAKNECSLASGSNPGKSMVAVIFRDLRGEHVILQGCRPRRSCQAKRRTDLDSGGLVACVRRWRSMLQDAPGASTRFRPKLWRPA
jgi:hypothetical protein